MTGVLVEGIFFVCVIHHGIYKAYIEQREQDVGIPMRDQHSGSRFSVQT